MYRYAFVDVSIRVYSRRFVFDLVFTEDPPKKSKRDEESEKNAPIPIRVLELVFFANNTFSTVAGLGSTTVLRGKWDVIGQEKDHLWMQIWRFGFGRSVSGSTYRYKEKHVCVFSILADKGIFSHIFRFQRCIATNSEGMGLTQDDEKAYWGLISYEYEEDNKQKDDENGINQEDGTKMERTKSGSDETPDNNGDRIEVKGSVLDGYGLEPLPVASFIMRESTEEELYDDEEEDEEEDVDEKLNRLFSKKDDDEEMDWSNAFQ